MSYSFCFVATKSLQYQAAERSGDEQDPEHGTHLSKSPLPASPLLQDFAVYQPPFPPLPMVAVHARLGLVLLDSVVIFGWVPSFPSPIPKTDIEHVSLPEFLALSVNSKAGFDTAEFLL